MHSRYVHSYSHIATIPADHALSTLRVMQVVDAGECPETVKTIIVCVCAANLITPQVMMTPVVRTLT